MAISKSVELASGVSYGYWICKEVNLKPESGEIVAVYDLYASKAMFDAGKEPVDRMKSVRLQIKNAGDSWSELEAVGITGAMIKQMLYNMALAFPQFAGGVVVDA